MKGAATDHDALSIIERVYAAGCEPDQRSGVADACQRLFPGVAFCLHISLEGASYDPVPAWAGWDPSFIETYKQYYHHANPYPEVLRAIRLERSCARPRSSAGGGSISSRSSTTG